MIKVWLKAMLVLFFLTVGTAWAETELEDPSPLIEKTANSIFNEINARRDEIREDSTIAEQIVRTDMLPLLDAAYSARLILGREARTATPQQLEDFAQAMNEQLIKKYATGLLEYRSREQIEVLELRGNIDPRATRVKTRFRLDSGGFALVDYVFRMTEDGWKVFDVVVEGISYVVSFKNQIQQEVRANGLDAVIERLSRGELDLAAG
ncbi:MAG TPA: ABC transporter substrate-binding protein [Xanthomonadales bacterium]|nr:ABC transporter substrate-binding protein [Xanthomonadales bacterium]